MDRAQADVIIRDLTPRLHPLALTGQQPSNKEPWFITPYMPYWFPNQTMPPKLMLYPKAADGAPDLVAIEYAGNSCNYKELYDKTENLKNGQELIQSTNLLWIKGPPGYSYNCVIFSGTPAPSLPAGKKQHMTWTVPRVVYYNTPNTREHVAYQGQMGQTTWIIEEKWMFTENQAHDNPGATVQVGAYNEVQKNFIEAWLVFGGKSLAALDFPSFFVDLRKECVELVPRSNYLTFYTPPRDRAHELDQEREVMERYAGIIRFNR